MATDRLILIGAGGHASVVLDALLATGVGRDRITVRADRAGVELLGLTSQAPEIEPQSKDIQFHVAIGNPAARLRLFATAQSAGGMPLTVIHPRAMVSSHAKVGRGAFIAAGAVIGPRAVLGDGVIVNHNAVVDHDCVVGGFAHIAPSAILGGAVAIGERCLIGAGSTVLPGVCIGGQVILGAGAVATRDLANGDWAGVPARNIDR